MENNLVTLNIENKPCKISPFESSLPPEAFPAWTKMDISPYQSAELSSFCNQVPLLVDATEQLRTPYYIVEWPEGVPHNLMQSATDKNAYYSMIVNADNKIEAHARFRRADGKAVALTGFAIMSMVTQQYFLTMINQKMTMMSRGIDKILEFLYGDKKAELLSEISFANYAYENFTSIMCHDAQRIATIFSLQEARKTAIKDVEFYLSDLYSAIHSQEDDIAVTVDKALQIRQCLELSIQLFVMCNLLEVYYSQNHDHGYLQNVESRVSVYVSKYEKQTLGYFNALDMAVGGFKPKLGKKFNPSTHRERLTPIIESLSGGEENLLMRSLHEGLYLPDKPTKFCVGGDGSMYVMA